MKKYLILIVLAAVTFTATGQEKAVLGVRAGVNFSDMTNKFDGESASIDSRTGFNVGVSYQLPLVSKLFLETGLNATTRGGRYDLRDEGLEGTAKFNMLYLQLPVAVSWHFDLKSFSIQPFVGGYYSYGLSGRLKAQGQEIKLFKDDEIEGEKVEKTLRNSDAGLRFGVGFTYKKHYYLGVGYDMGLLNIAKQKGEGKLRNNNLFISVGYNF